MTYSELKEALEKAEAQGVEPNSEVYVEGPYIYFPDENIFIDGLTGEF